MGFLGVFCIALEWSFPSAALPCSPAHITQKGNLQKPLLCFLYTITRGFCFNFFFASLELFSVCNLNLILAAKGTLSLGWRLFPGSKSSSSHWNRDKWMSFAKPTAPTQHLHIETVQWNPCSSPSHIPALGTQTQTPKHRLNGPGQGEHNFVFLDWHETTGRSFE